MARNSRSHLVNKTSDLLILINPRGNERLNLTMTYSVHEVCMRGAKVTYLIGQFFLVETDFVQLSQSKFGEYFLQMGWLPIMSLKDPIYP